MGACCCVGSCGKVLAGAVAIAAIGLGAGAVHSVIRPVTVTLSEPAPAPVTPPAATGVPTPADAAVAQAGGEPMAPPIAPGAQNPDAQPPSPAPTPAPVDPASLGRFVTIAQARSLHDQGVMFIDARTGPEFEAGHIPAAFRLAMEDWDKPETKDTLDFIVGFQNDPMVLYCKGPKCDASENLAILLQQAGFTRLHLMKDGYEGWVAAGHPTVQGKE